MLLTLVTMTRKPGSRFRSSGRVLATLAVASATVMGCASPPATSIQPTPIQPTHSNAEPPASETLPSNGPVPDPAAKNTSYIIDFPQSGTVGMVTFSPDQRSVFAVTCGKAGARAGAAPQVVSQDNPDATKMVVETLLDPLIRDHDSANFGDVKCVGRTLSDRGSRPVAGVMLVDENTQILVSIAGPVQAQRLEHDDPAGFTPRVQNSAANTCQAMNSKLTRLAGAPAKLTLKPCR